MYINISKTDCKNIVKKNLRVSGGGNSELEVALAKKCLSLYDRLGEIKNERKEYFEAIYSATVKFEKATNGNLMHKMAADLASGQQGAFQQAVKLDNKLKGLIDNDAKEKI